MTKNSTKRQLCNFWHKNIGKNCMHKLLMNLNPVVNFINVLFASFSCESVLAICFYLHFGFDTKILAKKHFSMKNTHVKCWWNWLRSDCRQRQESSKCVTKLSHYFNPIIRNEIINKALLCQVIKLKRVMTKPLD